MTPPFPRAQPNMVSTLAFILCSTGAHATTLEPVVVHGNYENAVGTSDSASQGAVTSKLIENRPTSRPGEILEFVPGVIVTQHSGEGKANQYFLRGFNLDHGTDFATSVDGMPVNMPSHAHGQGYSDVNWLIPELVNRIEYRKGPYFADQGDFASAGAAEMKLFESLPKGMASLTVGKDQYIRSLTAGSSDWRDGQLMYALELAHNSGPWERSDNFRKFNGVMRYSFGGTDARSSVTAMAYSAKWNATDQIPQRAIDQGLVSRYGTLDGTDHGETDRFSLSFNTQQKRENGIIKFNAYAIKSSLDLYSNFTYYLDNPVDLGPGLNPSGRNGDQFDQAEERLVLGFAGSRSWLSNWGGLDVTNTLGFQFRQDRLDPVGLYTAEGGVRTGTTQESKVRETAVGLYGENVVQWAPWLRSTLGLRADQYDFRVRSSIAQNSGNNSAGLTSPKLSLIFGPWSKTEYFANFGYGFHSNDARGTTAHLTPKEGLPTNPVEPLVRTRGGELGLRTEIIPGLQSSMALWQLNIGSELVFSGDAGDTEASRASKRTGIEWNNHYVANSWFQVDLDLALSKARFTEEDPAGQYVPGSVNRVASLGVSLLNLGRWSGQFQLRYFGPRPLIEDNSQQSTSTVLASARVGYKFNETWKVALDVFNLFDRKASDIEYYYPSRLQGEAQGGVNDIHFHPVEPRSFRFTVTTHF